MIRRASVTYKHPQEFVHSDSFILSNNAQTSPNSMYENKTHKH